MTVPAQPSRPKGAWHILPVDQWPPRHQEAWYRATRRESPLDRGGHAASLAPATRRKMTGNYGQFLWWLQVTGKLDPEADPATQMTRDLVACFIVERRKVVSDNSTYVNVRDLAMMMKCLEPEHNWKWIWQLAVVPRLREARAARRPVRLFPPGTLIHRLLIALKDGHGVRRLTSYRSIGSATACWWPSRLFRVSVYAISRRCASNTISSAGRLGGKSCSRATR